MTRSTTDEDITNSGNILNNLINDYIEKQLDSNEFLRRAVVVDVDTLGGQLVREGESLNPKNSLVARVLGESSGILSDDDLPVFWPLFSHDVMPIKQNEHVYIMYDSPDKSSGVWLCRAPQPLSVNDQPIENKNYVAGTAQYLADPDNDFQEFSAEQFIQGTETDPGSAPLPAEFVVENPPPPLYTARVGDRTIEGSHNSIIVLGRDRITDFNSGETEGAGCVDIVAGRATEDILESDHSRILVSSKTDTDKNNPELANVGPNAEPSASIVVKSDEVRIVARNGMKIVVDGGKLFINADKVIIGDGKSAEEPVVLGKKLEEFIGLVLDFIKTHDHPTGVGPSGGAVGPIAAGKLPSLDGFDISSLFSKTVISKP